MAVKTYLNDDEISAMIDKAEFLRDKVILTFLSDVGCRVSELLSVTVENITLERKEVLIPHLKRGAQKFRTVNIGERTTQLLEEYIEDMNPEDKLIDLKRQQVYNIVRSAGETIGLRGRCILNPETGKKHFVHPHNFRDSLAVAWLSFASGDIGKQKALQDHLGHKSFATTMRYFKLNPSAVKSVADEVRQHRFESIGKGSKTNG